MSRTESGQYHLIRAIELTDIDCHILDEDPKTLRISRVSKEECPTAICMEMENQDASGVTDSDIDANPEFIMRVSYATGSHNPKKFTDAYIKSYSSGTLCVRAAAPIGQVLT